ncbi:probable mitochondrial adenine nucleotide transporter BTL3 [Nymphaea colorata]|nr:probable mitochondrial adenine nucleotide transporter BTL3 [Nymphaea colorata]
MNPFSSHCNNLRKYFPQLQQEKDGHSAFDTNRCFFHSPLSFSTFSAALSQPDHARELAAVTAHLCGLGSQLALKFRGLVLNINGLHVQSQDCLNFANISQAASSRGILALGQTHVNAEKEEEQEVQRKNEEGNRSNGRDSFAEMHKYLLAGAVSTIISRTSMAPLERIKLECMVRPHLTWITTIQWIWGSEGLLGFWKGNLLNLFRMVPFKSINFICYDLYCDRLRQVNGKQELTSHDRLIGGGISGVLATVLCLPLDTIRTRLLAPGGEALGGVVGCVVHMVRREGLLSLYKGLTPALLSMGPASAVFYGVYDILKASYLRSSPQALEKELVEMGPVRTLIYGAIAGACAETVTYPLEVVRRQLQLHTAAKVGLIAAFGKMIERDGFGSMFAGLVPSTMQVLPSAALSYLFYEMMKSILKIN